MCVCGWGMRKGPTEWKRENWNHRKCPNSYPRRRLLLPKQQINIYELHFCNTFQLGCHKAFTFHALPSSLSPTSRPPTETIHLIRSVGGSSFFLSISMSKERQRKREGNNGKYIKHKLVLLKNQQVLVKAIQMITFVRIFFGS